MRQKIFITVFFITLTLPILGSLFEISSTYKSSENRQLSNSPQFQFTPKKNNNILQNAKKLYKETINYKNNFDTYYTDNFLYKQQLFEVYKYIKADIFNTNPLYKKVVTGNNGWLYLGDAFSNPALESLGALTFNSEEKTTIKNKLLKLKDSLAEDNIDFYFAIAPNKHSIYPKQLIKEYKPNTTKKDQLFSVLETSSISTIDLGSNFKDYSEQLYFKTNTHWNDLGAFYAYKNLIKKIHSKYPSTKILNKDDFTISKKISLQEDLTRMLNIQIEEPKNHFIVKEPKAKQQKAIYKTPSYFSPENDYELRFTSNVNSLKVLVFRDSFCSSMVKYISESFGETVFIWNYELAKEIITKEKPDIVILQMVERNIDDLLFIE